MDWFSRMHKGFVSMQHYSSTITSNYLCQCLTRPQQWYLLSTYAEIWNNKQLTFESQYSNYQYMLIQYIDSKAYV